MYVGLTRYRFVGQPGRLPGAAEEARASRASGGTDFSATERNRGRFPGGQAPRRPEPTKRSSDTHNGTSRECGRLPNAAENRIDRSGRLTRDGVGKQMFSVIAVKEAIADKHAYLAALCGSCASPFLFRPLMRIRRPVG